MKYTLEHAKKPTDIHQHLEDLYNFVVETNSKKVLELGVRTGESTVALLEGVHKTGGKLVSIDPCDFKDTKTMIRDYGLSGKWEYIVEGDLEFAKRCQEGAAWDIIFVDTSHEYDQTRKEIEAFMPMLKPGGCMIFHDTVSFPDGVLKPIKEFMARNPLYKFENKTNCNGLGVIRKPK